MALLTTATTLASLSHHPTPWILEKKSCCFTQTPALLSPALASSCKTPLNFQRHVIAMSSYNGGSSERQGPRQEGSRRGSRGGSRGRGGSIGRGRGPQYGQTPRPSEPITMSLEEFIAKANRIDQDDQEGQTRQGERFQARSFPSESKSGDVVAQANGTPRRAPENAARGLRAGRMDKSFDFSRGGSESARNIDVRDSRMRDLLASGRGLPQSRCLLSFPALISWAFLPSVADWCFLGDYTRLQHMYSFVIHMMHEQVKSRTRKRRTRRSQDAQL